MDKQQAEKALDIIRQVIQNTHEDLVAHNWGLIWLVHSFTNATAFTAIGILEQRGLGLVWYLGPLAAVAAVNMVLVALLMDRDRGVRSYLELQMHGIWTSFILFSLAAMGLLVVAPGASAKLFCPLMALFTGFSFAMMGVIFYRRLLALAVLFLAVALISPLVPDVQWFVFAAAWWIALIVPGYVMHQEKRRRKSAGETRVL